MTEPTLPDQASIHPKTLGKLSRGELPPPEVTNKRIRQGATRRQQQTLDDYDYVHPAWHIGMELADGDASRIEVLSETELMVHNNDNWRRR